MFNKNKKLENKKENYEEARAFLETLDFKNQPNDGNGADWYRSYNNMINVKYAQDLINFGRLLQKLEDKKQDT